MLVSILGCGSVGEPLPPLLNIPAKVTDFQVSRVADQAELRWTWPLLTTEGSTLRDLDRFEVRALDIPADAGAPPVEAFEELGQVLAVVEGDRLPKGGPGAEVALELDLANRLDKRTAFAVRGVTSNGKTAPWSDYVILQILRPAPAPKKLEAKSVAAGAQIAWQAVDRAVRYVLERRNSDGGDYAVIGSTDKSEFLDKTAPWETQVSYRVRSQVGEGEAAVESLPSIEVTLVRVDTFPPAVPAGLRAVAATDAVELTWSAVRDSDLAGYEVERNGEPAHEGLLSAPAFHDSAPKRDAPNEYRVRAVDEKGNRSELSAAVTVSLP